MESEVVAQQREQRRNTPQLDELEQPHAGSRANRLDEPLREHYRESAEKGRRTTRSPDSHQSQREFLTTPILEQLRKVERQSRAMQIGLIAGLIVLAVAADPFSMIEAGVSKPLVQSDELKLVDGRGSPRVFLRVYSGVPVMQVLDAKGNPRLSLGLRFDDTPFIDLSDTSGITRMSFQITGGGEPAMNMYDRRGKPTFSIN
jgi:hypothetical protein